MSVNKHFAFRDLSRYKPKPVILVPPRTQVAAVLPCIIGPRFESSVVLMEFLDSVEIDKDKFCEINYSVALLLSSDLLYNFSKCRKYNF